LKNDFRVILYSTCINKTIIQGKNHKTLVIVLLQNIN